MKMISRFICIALIALGVVCTIKLFDLFNVNSGEYGKIFIYETVGVEREFSRFDLGIIDFVKNEDTQNYECVYIYAAQEYDGKQDKYNLYFNNQPLVNVSQAAGKISGDLFIHFYDSNGTLISTLKMNVFVEYIASLTRINLISYNDNDALAYFNNYMEINGAILRVVKE